MIKSEAEAVIERIRKELEKNGVSFGFDQVTTTPNFGCDLDHSVAQVSEAPENLVELILIHDTGLWRFLEGSEVHHCARASSLACLLSQNRDPMTLTPSSSGQVGV